MALIMVMIIIIVLGILAGKLAYNMKVETTLARNAMEHPDLEWMGRSGVEYAKLILAQDAMDNTRPYDALNECWAGGTGGNIAASINASAFADPAMIPQCIPMKNIPLGRGVFSVEIVDLDRKFNINVANEFILQNALSKIGVDATLTPVIVDSILDWRDPDSAKRPSGTDGEDYIDNPNLGYPPYIVKNGPIDDITELLLIRGVSPAMFWGSSRGGGTSLMPRISNPIHRSHFEEPVYTVGLVELFTPMSGRLLNVNTASREALQALPQIDENCASQILEMRAGPDVFPGNDDDTPFVSVQDMIASVLCLNHPLLQQQLGGLLTVRSLVFEVRVTVDLGGNTRDYIAILRRNNARDIQVLTTYWR
jgi:general secretion pathway protein K